MTVTRSKYNSGCLFCSTLGDRGVINHHLNKFVPLLALKLKSIAKVAVDDLHPVSIITAARYNKQSTGTRARITEDEWEKPKLVEWIVWTEFGKRAIVPLSGPAALKKHSSRVKITKVWWEDKVAEAVHHIEDSAKNFDLDEFIDGVLEEAYSVWYPGEENKGFEDEDDATFEDPPVADGPTFAAINTTAPKSSAYIATRMAAIVMDPEDDEVEEFQTKFQEIVSQEKETETEIEPQTFPSFNLFESYESYEESDSNERLMKSQIIYPDIYPDIYL